MRNWTGFPYNCVTRSRRRDNSESLPAGRCDPYPVAHLHKISPQKGISPYLMSASGSSTIPGHMPCHTRRHGGAPVPRRLRTPRARPCPAPSWESHALLSHNGDRTPCAARSAPPQPQRTGDQPCRACVDERNQQAALQHVEHARQKRSMRDKAVVQLRHPVDDRGRAREPERTGAPMLTPSRASSICRVMNATTYRA